MDPLLPLVITTAGAGAATITVVIERGYEERKGGTSEKSMGGQDMTMTRDSPWIPSFSLPPPLPGLVPPPSPML